MSSHPVNASDLNNLASEPLSAKDKSLQSRPLATEAQLDDWEICRETFFTSCCNEAGGRFHYDNHGMEGCQCLIGDDGEEDLIDAFDKCINRECPRLVVGPVIGAVHSYGASLSEQ